MPFYISSRVTHDSPRNDRPRNDRPHNDRQAFAPRTIWLLSRPRVGRSMAFVDSNGQSVVTSRIQRILAGTSSNAVYVQTNNSLYRLQHSPRRGG